IRDFHVTGVQTCALPICGHLYTFLFRGVPLLVQLMLAYYFLPTLGINVSPLTAAIAAISLCEGAYLGEILRGGFMGIPRGQVERSEERRVRKEGRSRR